MKGMLIMDMLKKFFPFSFGAKDVANLIIKIIIYLVIDVVLGFVIGLLSGIVVDISYGFIDPRIRMGEK